MKYRKIEKQRTKTTKVKYNFQHVKTLFNFT